MILKIQRPLSSNVADPPWFVYSEDREVEAHIPAAKVGDGLRLMMGNAPKIYVDGEIAADGNLVIERQVADRNW